MLRYIAGRLAWTLVVLWAIVTLTFAATFLSPIDPAKSYAGPRASPEVLEQTRENFGLNDSVLVQYGRYVSRIAQGDLGESFASGQPVNELLFSRLPHTALLAFAAAIVQLSIGLPLGVYAALHRGQLIDRLILTGTLVGVVVPSFALGFLLLYFFAFKIQIFPLGGSASFSSLILPAITLGVAGAAWYARMLRSTMLNILSEDYIRTARAKGMPERTVVMRHALRNALGPIIAMIGVDLGVFLGGVLVIERVFNWPGIGDAAWRAISFNDIPVVMGAVLIAAFFVTMFNLLADTVNVVVDPRARPGSA
jgi:peptide/nickel transport system permease protein